MNRFWLIGGMLVLALAGITSWLTANRQAEVEQLPVLAEATEPGCDSPGQIWLTVGNASDWSVLTADGVISIARSYDETPIAVGNFHLDGPLLPGLQRHFCASIDEPQLSGKDRKLVWWLARSTAVVFGEKSGNPLNPADQGFVLRTSRQR